MNRGNYIRRENIVSSQPEVVALYFATFQRLIRYDERRDAQFATRRIAPGLLTSLGFFWANWVNFPLVHSRLGAHYSLRTFNRDRNAWRSIAAFYLRGSHLGDVTVTFFMQYPSFTHLSFPFSKSYRRSCVSAARNPV